MRSSGGWRRDLRRAVLWHRRLLAAGLVAGSVALGLDVLRPRPPATAAVVVAARDLPGGTVLTGDDLRTDRLPPDAVPDDALPPRAPPDGRVLAAPLGRGEVVTRHRLVGADLAEAYGAGLVAVPVRLADAATVDLLAPGDLVDVLAAEAADPAGAGAVRVHTVAPRVRVAAVPGPADAAAAVEDGGLVVLATTPAVAAGLARAAVVARLSVVLRAG